MKAMPSWDIESDLTSLILEHESGAIIDGPNDKDFRVTNERAGNDGDTHAIMDTVKVFSIVGPEVVWIRDRRVHLSIWNMPAVPVLLPRTSA
jgi:hypothetical protein